MSNATVKATTITLTIDQETMDALVALANGRSITDQAVVALRRGVQDITYRREHQKEQYTKQKQERLAMRAFKLEHPEEFAAALAAVRERQ